MTRFTPTPPTAHPLLGRRAVLKGLLTAAGIAAAAPTLAACGGGGSGGSDSKTVTFGSNYSDQVPRTAIAAVLEDFKKQSGIAATVNTKDHETFQQQITNYLQGHPDDVYSWFAGFRMRYFAGKGLSGDISDLWGQLGGNYTQAQKEASTGNDGKQYFVPFYSYPWAVFYRPSIWQQHGYTVPKTLDELVTLGGKMKTDGIVPIAVGQSNGWPQLGTFDQLNFRTNGYDFHMSLMAGKEDWAGKKVRDVFDNWKRLLPLYQENALGRTWQDAAQTVLQGKGGMMVIGSQQIGQQFAGKLDDLDFFPFPEINSAYGTDTVEAPIDGFMMAKKPANADNAKKLLTYLSTPEAQLAYLKSDPTSIAASSKVDPAGYNALQKKAMDFVGKAKHITQFLDRDTDPRFASDAMINGVNAFLNKPDDIDGLVNGLASQAKSIFTG
ncbi:carbohydrate ABC transporter substrate-binding protein [Solihabitans fulvus]|uniref:Carbohydrate ABC transporter substrate-binding protein n=1 Tax=Solihabitans fulvus TaxID=1892852 RepID=A0A5B2WJ19_9PSEU|nr:ABC transporter substrate-binding protein [Solihabitans fulvus]KAA2252123.1 carbohydrate ABC transporter substrate-binding protein [Solihabitans fulvus]